MKTEFLVCLVLFIGGMLGRSGYEDLKDKGKISGGNKLAFVSVFSVMTLMRASWFAMCPLDPLRLDLPAWIHSVGFGIDVAGMVLAIAAVVQLRGPENVKRLVTAGGVVQGPLFDVYRLHHMDSRMEHVPWCSDVLFRRADRNLEDSQVGEAGRIQARGSL